MGRFGQCSASQAAEAGAILLGLYPKGSAEDPETYAAGVATILASYPPEVVRQVCSPFGIASKTKWLPSVYEVKEACEIAMGPYYARAAERQNEEEMRAAQKAREAKYGPDPIPEEQMAANRERVANILAKFKKSQPPVEGRPKITGDMDKMQAEANLAQIKPLGPEFADDLKRLINFSVDKHPGMR